MFHGLLWDVFGDFVLLAAKLHSLCIFARCIQRSATSSKVEDFAFCTKGVKVAAWMHNRFGTGMFRGHYSISLRPWLGSMRLGVQRGLEKKVVSE